MPVSPIPVVLTLLLIVIPAICSRFGRRPFLWALVSSAGALLLILGASFVPGVMLRSKASKGDSAAMYQLARWTENHSGQINRWILWPQYPDTLGGYRWLERSASAGYVPAIYAMGVRLKHGQFVPRPTNWAGPSGNVFEQPAKGQELIDTALNLGYKPRVDEEYFYWQVYRREDAEP
ncbi:MAG: hypothetical protein AAF802_26805 [Planctomycetota bacterium]